jgi:hypothetical protein
MISRHLVQHWKALGTAILLAGLLAPSLAAQVDGGAELIGPVTGGERGRPFGAYPPAATPAGYMEEEWFVTGAARSYTRAGEWTTDGRWSVDPDESANYTVRILVRRPEDSSAFNGVVVVEWLNVTAMSEGAADYSQMEEELLRSGYAWVGVGAQAVGIHAPNTGLKAWDPQRYEALAHPGDRFSYDIFSQVATLLRETNSPPHPLAGLEVRHFVATGRSQSAFRLVTYLNAFHSQTDLFDGYFVHSRGGSAAGLRSEALSPDQPPIPAGAWIRTDLDVPVLDVQAEGDMTTLRSHLTRQPASDVYRRWEIAGAAHAEVPMWVVQVPPGPSMGPGCATPVNAAPHDAVVRAGLHALTEWVRNGVAPPQSPDIELGDPAAPDPIVRDEWGNALGGIRLPHLEAPTATVDGRENAVATAVPGVQNFCRLFGRTTPFDESTLRRLYPAQDAFLRQYVMAVDALERDGYLLAHDAEEARRAAAESTIGRW